MADQRGGLNVRRGEGFGVGIRDGVLDLLGRGNQGVGVDDD